jgi:branched-chain amino acid transport system substrate-binding protein
MSAPTSTKIGIKLAAMLIIGLIIGTGIGYGIFAFTTPAKPEKIEYPIGIVLPLSGTLAGWGNDMKAFVELAERDIDAMLEAADSPIRFKYIIEDSKTSAEDALKAIQSLVETHGCQVIAGVPLSAELIGAKSYLDSHKIVAISATSSTPQLDVPDYIFRMIYSNTISTRQSTEAFLSLGYNKVVVLYRDDPWGSGNNDVIVKYCNEKGFPVKSVRYTPNLPDYASEVATLVKTVQDIAGGDYAHTAIIMFAWEAEQLNILTHAMTEEVLGKVRWFGSSLFPALIPPQNPSTDIAKFMVKVQMWGTEPRAPEGTIANKLMKEVEAKVGHAPSFEHVYGYDSLWAAALCILAAGRYDGEAIKNVVPYVVNRYFGATGPKTLNENGDQSFADSSFYGVVISPDGKITYMYYGHYLGMEGKPVIYPTPVPRI